MNKISQVTKNSDIFPILPRTLQSFQGESDLAIRDYLLSDPLRELFVIGEIQELLELGCLPDDKAKAVIQARFKKIGKTALPKWLKLIAKK